METNRSRWRYLVLGPAAELPIAVLALASSEMFGPSAAVTAALGIFLLYATPFVGVASFVGLVLDGWRQDGSRWRWYAGVVVVVTAFLSYHAAGSAEGDAFFGLWEPAVALALVMVPVGFAYWFRGWQLSSRRELAADSS